MDGYTGRFLSLDLTNKVVESGEIPEEWISDYVGGEGLGARYLYEHMDFKAMPLDSEQPIILATGPLTGTSAPSSGRLCIVFYSPLTKTVGASNCGGFLAPEIKKAGYDLILVKGKSEKPVSIAINNQEVEIVGSEDIWGLGVKETEKKLTEKLKTKWNVNGFEFASIGVAGEKQVLYASVMTDSHRAAGRGGLGALFGSKNLKSIAVHGDNPIKISDRNELKKSSKKARKELFSEHFVKEELKPYGTPSFFAAIDGLGLLPTKNWQKTTYPEAKGHLDHEAYHETLDVKPYGCHGCPIACGRITEIKEGKYKGEKGGGPEYETVAAFGSKCLNLDLNSIAMAGYICDNQGLDVISAGQVIATAMEWYDQGIITKETTDGLKLEWGNEKAIIQLLEKIIERKGFGDILADGVMRAAEKIGEKAKYAAIHVKGMEMAADGVRASKGEAVVHAVSPRGADHLRPWAPTIEAFGYREEELDITSDEIDPLDDGNKEWIKPFQEHLMTTNMLGICLFTSITLANKPSTYAELYSKATGKTTNKKELLKKAERVINLERIINNKLGHTKKTDTIPQRFKKEPAPDGPGKGQTVNLEKGLKSYYKAMGWDTKTGKPTPKTLKKLDLTWTK
ncbi:aldehyde ferredoxin oxidoreductase family protein [Methanonatronarchaeum sp. AMET-Sl]|uniref:aldehyde ferredoxin oxidoreductase family protein n=1 Tax=Methanonatronarchaeum sp. AMET-Sl TaxID=3037654 RepID=UPI00244E0C9E|nr:aldehyde ferredoxin oxidoreductase family protein [Methanonatronarchaeum sp. AMET-Sl]WGI18018.1 aldehyde ferredoxin oxidoreductase family protein [Methanonatronarchaeum sp. AMET-Sl]